MTDSFSRLSIALADSYRLERQLGEGGMATVYLAEDLKHQRNVALKVLKPELSAVLGGERFLREISVTANLQHPHILQLFDSGKAEGREGGLEFLYYVMPYVEGETLRDLLNRETQLSIEDVVTITRTIASALDFAHKRGVVHRDIKPENILMHEGVAVVADFGIAVAVRSAGGDRLTETGLSIGTPSYMSPEQVVGERDLDARSDVYALACMTYEMLAGDPPFVASNPQAVMAKHVTDPAPPVTTTRPNVRAALANAVAKALSKVPADRYDSAGAFVAGLTAEDTADEAEVKSLVVLPFANQSPDPDNEFFVDGLTEEVIADLSRLNGLRVISRNSAMTLKGTSKDTRTLARELGVTHLVTGAVRRAGPALRVTAELVEAKTDVPIWSEKYSGTVEDVFGIQEEIAQKIVAALELQLTDAEKQQVAERPIENVVAYECYLRARQEMYRWTPDAQRRALRLVDDAMEIVGETPLLLATAGQVHWSLVNTSIVPASQGFLRASEFVDRALALDSESGPAIFVRGLIAGLKGDRESALPDLYRAMELRPGDANVVAETCRFSNSSGLRNQWPLIEELTRIDPLSMVTPLVVSTYRWLNGPREEAAAPARRSIEMAPEPSMAHTNGGWHIAEAGFREEAVEILAYAGREMVDPVGRAHAQFLALALQGKEDDACSVVTPGLEQGLTTEIPCRMQADGYALLGRTEDALRWLRRAVDGGFIHYPSLAEDGLFLESLRGDPRFQALLDEVKPRWEAVVEWERSL